MMQAQGGGVTSVGGGGEPASLTCMGTGTPPQGSTLPSSLPPPPTGNQPPPPQWPHSLAKLVA